ncbi:hypothetical protein ACOSQ3_031869 [Xanthoceras sorbifolium]
MTIDKSWIELNRSTSEYFKGVEKFLDYVFTHNRFGDSKIFCPCEKCNNRYRRVRSEVQEHLFSNLSFLVKLMHIKCINGWSNKSFNMLLEILKDPFPMSLECPVCRLPRWQPKGNSGKVKNVPWKVLRYFPITSRLQRLFISSKTAASMR